MQKLWGMVIAPTSFMLMLALSWTIGGCGGPVDQASTTSPPVTAATTSTTLETTTTVASETTSTDAATTTSVATATTLPSGPPTLADVEGFRQWLKMNIEPIPGRVHGLTDIYINQDRQTIGPDGDLVFPFPDGTLVVKEQLEGTLVAIMRKTAGIDPEHGDWQWIEYRTSSAVAGKDAQCWNCHSQAKDADWVFTVLETP